MISEKVQLMSMIHVLNVTVILFFSLQVQLSLLHI